jgi:hypothetical protein
MVGEWVNLGVLQPCPRWGEPLDLADFPRRRSRGIEHDARNEVVNVVLTIPLDNEMWGLKIGRGFFPKLSKAAHDRIFARIEESTG